MIHSIAGCIQNVAFAGIFPRIGSFDAHEENANITMPRNCTLARVEGRRIVSPRQGAKTLSSERVFSCAFALCGIDSEFRFAFLGFILLCCDSAATLSSGENLNQWDR
jgi:hypothetical protein